MNKTNQIMRTKNINAREARKLIPQLLDLIGLSLNKWGHEEK
jgi:hypothetical protein